jgi:bifunctional non-homologous end joining protein LigD
MLARETDKPFSDPRWIYELKWDGFRAIAELDGSKVKLYSRNGNSFSESYPPVVHALGKLKLKAVMDGEIIVVDGKGRPSFQKLQNYKRDASVQIQFRVFDLLELNGKDLTGLPLVTRKERLKSLLPSGDPIIKYSDHVSENGLGLFRSAQEMDLEGIIAKQADSEYFPGARSTSWLKIKHHKTTEAVIAGYTEPGGSRKHFGALLLGMYDGGKLRYIGHTGTGFTALTLKALFEKLRTLQQRSTPFDPPVKTNMPAIWVKPQLVAEIKYSEWTQEGKLRHPVFLRLRKDKTAKEVTMATAKPVKKAARPAKKAGVKTAKKTAKKTAVKTTVKPAPVKKQAMKAVKAPEKKDEKEDFLPFGKIRVKITNAGKVFWPDEGFTKGDVIRYYQEISHYILPYLKDRPQSLLRNPNGIGDRGFFQKDAGDEAPPWVRSEPIYSPSADKMIDYIICNDAATLAYLNNLGCIELNPWHSTIKKPDHPDYLIIDIDPSDKNTFDQVIEAANVVKDIFGRAGVSCYCKTSGASGLHVYAPAGKKYSYDQLKDFSHLVCMLAAQQLPDSTTLERSLKKRGDKRIYMDYLQNRKGQTISSVYSLRPKPGATVSMPLTWKEVKPGLKPTDFTIRNALKRIKKAGDLFAGVLGPGLDLKKSLGSLDK